MKNIKKPKRFFSKIDAIVLLIIIGGFLTAGLLIKGVLQKDTYITVELLAAGGEWWWGVPPPYYWNVTALHKGSIEYDVQKKPLVEILDIVKEGYDNRKYALIKARLKVKKNVRANTYTFRQEEVKIGKIINIAPDNIAVIANVVSIEGVGQMGTKEKRTITAKKFHQTPYEVDQIYEGDVMKNDKGEIVAEILDKQVEPSDVETTSWLGELSIKKSPYFRDVTFRVRAEVIKDGDQEYFNYYQPVQLGNEISIQFIKSTQQFYIVKIE
jgi:hypothetical protein